MRVSPRTESARAAAPPEEGAALLFALAATNLVEAAHPLDSPERAWLARARMGAGMR